MSLFVGLRVGLRNGLRSGLNPGATATIVAAIAGDSNGAGIGVLDARDPTFASTNTAVQYNMRYSNGTGPPPVFVDTPYADMTLGQLAGYAPSNSQSMGIEITLGPTLLASSAAPAILKYAVSGSTLANEWLPTSTYPAAGSGNLYHLWVARMHAFEAQLGKTLDIITVSLGTNDAAAVGTANAFQANMGTFCTQVRLDFPGAVIVWIKTNPNTGNTFTSTVIAGQIAYAATDPLLALVDNTDLGLLGDGLHYLTDGYLTLGQRCAIAGLDKLSIARRAVTVTPAVIQYGPTAHGAGNLSIIAPGDVQNGDLLLLGVVTGVLGIANATPTGWTLVKTATSTASGATEHLSVFSKAATTADITTNLGHAGPASYVADLADAENIGQMICLRGPNANPTVDVSQATGPNTFDTGPATVTGVTTAAAHELVLVFSGGFCGSNNGMAITNGTLASFTELLDGAHLLPDTNFQVMTLTAGQLAAAGASGSFAMTSTANMIALAVVVGVRP